MPKLSLLFLFFFSTAAYCQTTYDISGNITDGRDQPIAVGDVLLFPIENDTIVKYTSILDGNFSLHNVNKGNYRLRLSCLGFETVEKKIELEENLSVSIRLKEKTTQLEETEVIAAKSIVTNTHGNLKIDVTNPVFSSIPDPMDLLSILPSLQINADRESISVVGKGTPLIYMGNQRITQEEFKALSVEEIASIELVLNPSAKYEAEGRAVLLITRRSSDTEGVKLNLSETTSFRQNFNNYSSLNGSYKKDALTLKANFSYNDLKTWESNQFEFEIPRIDVLTDYRVLIDPNNRIQFNGGGGLFYQINADDYFSANLTLRLQTDDFIIDTDTFLRQGLHEDIIATLTNNANKKEFFSGNFNYNKRFKSKLNLFAGGQYSSFVQHLNTDISNNFNTTAFLRSQERQQKYRIDVLAYRLDIEKAFKNNMKVEFGANISTARATALSDIRFFESETNSNSNIAYDYSEKTLAAYAQLSGDLGKKLRFNTGLRVENNEVRGEEVNNLLVNRESTNLFPKAMLNFAIDSTKNLTFNYSRSIDRPSYSRASSISAFINPFLEGAGNVNLRPTLTDEISANFQFKKSSISINYSMRKNPMFFTIGYEDNADYAVLSLENLEKETGIDITLAVPLTKGIWTSTNTTTLSTRRIGDASAITGPINPYFYFYTNHQFKLRKNTTVSFGGWALTKRSEGIFERNAMIVLNAALTKTFFNKIHCALRFNDITRAMNFEERYTINGVKADGVYIADAHEIAFSIKYTFGKKRDFNYRNKDVDENLDRIR